MGQRPRCFKPDTIYEQTQRTVDRQFLFAPIPGMKNIRKGAIFSTPARTTECLDDESVAEQMFYAITNPVKDNLVDRVEHWEGFSSYSQVALGKDETYTYYDLTQYNKQKHKPDAKPLGAFLKRVRIEFSQLPHLSHLKPGKYQSNFNGRVSQSFSQSSRASRSAQSLLSSTLPHAPNHQNPTPRSQRSQRCRG